MRRGTGSWPVPLLLCRTSDLPLQVPVTSEVTGTSFAEDGDGEHVVYDNGVDQAIGSGSIVVHAK